MATLRNAAFAVALVLSGAALQPAAAMPVADLSAFGSQSFEGRFTTGQALRFENQAIEDASASYFDFDAIITLGALALAVGALAGVGAVAARRAREAEKNAAPAWRETVMRALQADLTAYTDSYRRAA